MFNKLVEGFHDSAIIAQFVVGDLQANELKAYLLKDGEEFDDLPPEDKAKFIDMLEGLVVSQQEMVRLVDIALKQNAKLYRLAVGALTKEGFSPSESAAIVAQQGHGIKVSQ